MSFLFYRLMYPLAIPNQICKRFGNTAALLAGLALLHCQPGLANEPAASAEQPARDNQPLKIVDAPSKLSANPDITRQRLLYRDAKAALKRNDGTFTKLRHSLQSYPLAVYLDYLYFKKHIAITDFDTIDAAFDQTGYEYYVNRLKRQRLNYLGNAGNWRQFLASYDPALATSNLRCLYARALYKQGHKEAGLKLSKALWLTPKSMPDSCDANFYVLSNEKQISSELAWQRFLNAFPINEITLSNYLTRFMEGPQREAADAIFLLYRNPTSLPANWHKLVNILDISQVERFSPGSAQAIQTFLLKRLTRSDHPAAVNLLNQTLSERRNTGLEENQHISMLDELRQYILTRYALEDYNELPTLYQALQQPSDTQSLEWLLRSLIATSQWEKLQSTITELPEELKSQERWQYWQLRSGQLAGKLEKNQLDQLVELSKQGSFYGFAAATALKLPLEINVQTLPKHTASESNIHLQQAIEHYIQQEHEAAQRAWLKGIAGFDTEQRLSAAYLASSVGWHHQAISTAAAAKAWQHYHIRFPDVYTEYFEREAFRYNQMPQWFYATARQESALSSTARSHAGAMGLMQILPSTAKQLARKNHLTYQRSKLFDVNYSIRLGTAYLEELHQRYQNRALSSAAYNAGPHRVDAWLKNLESPLPLDAWIETIRFSETRQYVQNVLSFGLIHARLHPDQSNLPRPWPEFAFFAQGEHIVMPFTQQIQIAQQRQSGQQTGTTQQTITAANSD